MSGAAGKQGPENRGRKTGGGKQGAENRGRKTRRARRANGEESERPDDGSAGRGKGRKNREKSGRKAESESNEKKETNSRFNLTEAFLRGRIRMKACYFVNHGGR